MPASAAVPSDMEATDTELMTRLAAGDDLALNALMARWRDRVAAFLYRMTRHSDTAADLAQETFVKLYQARNRYRPEGKFSTYLFAIAANLGRNHARWKRRHPTVSLDDDSDSKSLLAEAVNPGQTPEEAATSAEGLRAVHSAFQALPDDLRVTMSLFIYEGMSYAEIASIVGCSPKAAETRIYRARQFLKEKLKDIRA
ncbi:MAG: sigma-70 family RNA polymerase sigma factor [Verrucomicrobiae bacterium]|nr:sigma-70 family RNA polymerase sigma factor [Verrucomicrobiae bacterium]